MALSSKLAKLVLLRSRTISTSAPLAGSSKVNLFNLNFDRRIKHDYKESLDYMESEVYKSTYKEFLVWKIYRRNHKTQYPSRNTRPSCIKDGKLSTSYPCPICRDEYLILHPENTKLLEQFINPNTGAIITPEHHGLCQKQYRNLIISVMIAKDIGTLTYDVPERLYNYRDYYEEHNHG